MYATGIVYVFSQKDAETLASEFQKRGIVAYPYHANMQPDEKSRVHRKWTSNKIQVSEWHEYWCRLLTFFCFKDTGAPCGFLTSPKTSFTIFDFIAPVLEWLPPDWRIRWSWSLAPAFYPLLPCHWKIKCTHSPSWKWSSISIVLL